jgi:hypothetical protein
VEIGAAAHVHDLLDEVFELLRVERRAVGDVARPRHGPVRQKRDDAGAREHDRLVEELAPALHRRVLPVPVAPEDRGERTLAVRHDEVRGDAPALRARVRQVPDHDVSPLLDGLRDGVDASLRVVGEVRLG